LLSDYRDMAKWFGAHYNKEVRFSSAELSVRKGSIILSISVVFTILLNT